MSKVQRKKIIILLCLIFQTYLIIPQLEFFSFVSPRQYRGKHISFKVEKTSVQFLNIPMNSYMTLLKSFNFRVEVFSESTGIMIPTLQGYFKNQEQQHIVSIVAINLKSVIKSFLRMVWGGSSHNIVIYDIGQYFQLLGLRVCHGGQKLFAFVI